MSEDEHLVKAIVLGKNLTFQMNKSRDVNFKNYVGLPPGSYPSITPWWFEFEIKGAGCPEIVEQEGHIEFSKTLPKFATRGLKGFESDTMFEITIRLFDTTVRNQK